MNKAPPPQRGAVLILFAVLLPILLGFAALAMDVAFVVMTKARMQNAADAAALAGASGLLAGDNLANARLTALNLANLNGYTADASTVVTISNPPGANPNGTTPTFAADTTYVRATIVQTVDTYFAKILGFSTIALTATAVAAPGNLALPCMMSMASNLSGALTITGNGTIVANNCNIVVNSTSPTAMRITGNVSVTASAINVVGGYTKTGNGTISTVTTNAPVLADPFASIPKPSFTSCTYTSFFRTGNGAITLNPGTYCDGITITGNHSVAFNPGLYLVYGGGILLTGNISPISGTGVTIYNSGNGTSYPYGDITITGNTTVNLAAPTTGIYSGMLMMQDPANTRDATFTGNSGSTYLGNLYFPRAGLTLTGNVSTTIPMGAVVAEDIFITGNTSFSLTNTYGNSSTTGKKINLYQ